MLRASKLKAVIDMEADSKESGKAAWRCPQQGGGRFLLKKPQSGSRVIKNGKLLFPLP